VLSPLQLFGRASDYFSDQRRLLQEKRRSEAAAGRAIGHGQHGASLDAEYGQLRTLLGAAERFNNTAVLAEVVHVSRNPFSHKILVNKGTNHGVVQGLPAIDGTGVVGQVTTVTPFPAKSPC